MVRCTGLGLFSLLFLNLTATLGVGPGGLEEPRTILPAAVRTQSPSDDASSMAILGRSDLKMGSVHETWEPAPVMLVVHIPLRDTEPGAGSAALVLTMPPRGPILLDVLEESPDHGAAPLSTEAGFGVSDLLGQPLLLTRFNQG